MEGGPFIRSRMPEVAAGSFDPEIGMAIAPLGDQLLFMKMATVGFSVFAEFIFVKWQQ